MLRQIVGRNIVERDLEWLKSIAGSYQIIVDLGCGDGLYSYRQAQQNPSKFYIAIDANSQVLQKLSNKVAHQKLSNLIFLQHAAEDLPVELAEKVDHLMILYPWGSLLKIVVDADKKLADILKILKPKASLEITFTYSPEYEASMISEYELPLLGEEYLAGLRQKFTALGFENIQLIRNTDVSDINKTSWGKKINSQRERLVYTICGSLT